MNGSEITMTRPAIKSMISHWKNEFEQQIELNEFYSGEHFSPIPPRFRDQFRFELFPQPFYGYFSDDMKDDIFMPLLNPGPVSTRHVTDLFKGQPYPAAKRIWNQVIKDRHTSGWTKLKFHEREKEYDLELGPNHWRRKKLVQVRRIVGDVGFLHTIEFFPFHSDRWKAGMVSQKMWFRNLTSTQLAIDVIEEFSSLRLVKHILGIGLPWADILTSYPDKFRPDGEPIFLTGEKGRVGHRFFKFKPTKNPNGLPIVIYSGSSMDLPVNTQEATSTLREVLEI